MPKNNKVPLGKYKFNKLSSTLLSFTFTYLYFNQNNCLPFNAKPISTIHPLYQGKKLFFHFTRPLDEYFPDFGFPNIKSTRPKNDEPLLLISYSKWRRRVDVIIRDACAHGRHGSEGWRQRSIDRRSEKARINFFMDLSVDLWAIFSEDSMVLKYCKWKKN